MTEVRAEETEFPGKGVTLFRRSMRPEAPAWCRLGIVHGYGEHSGRFVHFMEWLARHGVETHALDLRGQGRSGGARGFVRRWEDYLEDVDAFLAEEAVRGGRDEPLFLLGHSHGGLVTAAAAERGLEGVSGCVLTSPFLRSCMHVPAYKKVLARVVDPLLPSLRIPTGLRHEWMSADDRMREESRFDPLMTRTATPRWYLDHQRAQGEACRRAPDLRLPLLLLIGDADPVSDPRTAHDFYMQAGSEDKTFRLYPGMLHELLREAERERVFEHILQWLREHAG